MPAVFGQNTSAASTPNPYVERIPGTDDTFEMIYIPGGSFKLGSPETEEGHEPDESPQKEVQIDPFYIGATEITFDVYLVYRMRELDNDSSYVQDAPFQADAMSRPSPPYEYPSHGMGHTGYPAVSMTQIAALEFGRWLSFKTGRLYRLPTEAEWEYACRAGSETSYFFAGDAQHLTDYAWFEGNSDEEYHLVGTKKPNAFGLFDMAGNVSEWTMDQYEADYYRKVASGAANPWRKPDRRRPRTVRGGAYDDDADALRCANRTKSSLRWKRRDPQIPKSYWWNTDSPFVGFRLVRPAKKYTFEEIQAFWKEVLPY